MSSTLQAQLASLHGAKSSSRRHEEAVGRGIHHSVNVGHSLSVSSAKFKPSILYPDARAAADISVATIREDGIAALRQLEVLTGNDRFTSREIIHGLFGPQSLQLEKRRLAKAEWQTIHNQISSLLYCLAAAHSSEETQSSSSGSAAVLRVMEYLLRRYDIHVSSPHLLLLTCLPQHEAPFFARILQLVDLSAMPMWTWLRPYAAAGAPPLSRSAIANRASKDDALLVELLQLAKDIAMSESSSSRILSFVAATVAEALSKQARGGTSSQLSEQTVRNVLPFVLSACGGGGEDVAEKQPLFLCCREWRGLGYILATVISENCTLGSAAREVIAVTMAKGALLIDKEGDNNQEDHLEAATDTILALSAFLIQNNDNRSNENLAGITLLKPESVAEEETPKTIIGCELPRSTFLALCRHRLLASALGNAVQERNIDITGLLAAILGRAISYLSDERDGKRLGSQIIQSLAEEAGLHRVWQTGKQHTLAASVAAQIISLFAESFSSPTNIDNYKESLIAVYRASRIGCDRGVASAVSSWPGKDDQGKGRIQLLLTSAFGATAKVTDDEEPVKKPFSPKKDSSWINLIPPRIALEHADAPVRVAAIQRLAHQIRIEHLDQKAVEDDISLAASLLRRAAVDENVTVAIAAMSAFSSLHREKCIAYAPTAMEATLVARQWSLLQKSSEKRRGKKHREENDDPSQSFTEDDILAVCGAIDLCVAASEAYLSQPDLYLLIQCIVVHSLSDELKEDFDKSLNKISKPMIDKLQRTIRDALVHALQAAFGEEFSVEHSTATILATSSTCRDILKGVLLRFSSESEQDSISIEKDFSSVAQSRFVRVMLSAFYSIFGNASFSIDCPTCSVLQSAFLYMIENTKLSEKETESLLRCVKKFIRSALFPKGDTQLFSESAVYFVKQLASVGSSKTFNSFSLPAIEELNAIYIGEFGNDTPNLLLEVCTIPSARDEAITRLLHCLREKSLSLCFNAGELVLALSLVSHSHRSVRKGALELLSETATTEKSFGIDVSLVSNIAAASMKAKLELGGANALVDFLKECIVKSSSPDLLRKSLLNQCVLCTIGERGSRAKQSFSNHKFAGSLSAASILLNAMEDAGESMFSLEKRWESCGKLIFDVLINQPSDDETARPEKPLVDTVVRMLKGVIVYDINSTSLITGPSGRSRSYSVGNAEDLAWVKQYPVSMSKSILNCLGSCLSLGRMTYVAKVMLRLVLSRQSWATHIFSALPDKNRRQIVLTLMQVKENLDDEEAGFALFELPLKIDDFVYLLQAVDDSPSSSNSKLVSLTQLSECIRRRAQKLETPKLWDVASILFQRLASLSAATDENSIHLDNGSEYTRYSLLQTLNIVCREYKMHHDEKAPSHSNRRSRSRSSSLGSAEKERSPSSLTSFSEMLVGLLGTGTLPSESQTIYPLESTQARSIAITLLSNLCALDPRSSSHCLSTALISLIASCSSRNIGSDSFELVSMVTKTIIDLADKSDFSAVIVYRNFAWNCQTLPLTFTAREGLYQNFIDPLIKSLENHLVGKAVASILGITLAVAAKRRIDCKSAEDFDVDSSSVKLCIQVLRKLSPFHQTSATFELLGYAGHLMNTLVRSDIKSSQEEKTDELNVNDGIFCVTSTQMLDVALNDSDDSHFTHAEHKFSSKETKCVMSLITALLTMVRDGLLSPTIKKVIRSSEEGAELCLSVWKELMQVQVSSCMRRSNVAAFSEREFWRAAPETIYSCLATLQRLLPVPHFLASVLTVLREEDVDASVRKYALALLGERSGEVDPESSEFLLFLEVIPELVEMCASSIACKGVGEHESRRKVILQQSALMAIEGLVQSLFSTGRITKPSKMETTILLDCLSKTSKIALESTQKFGEALQENQRYINDGYLFSSSILCSATIVSAIQVSALPQLKSLVATLVTCLQSINHIKKANATEFMVSGECTESLEVLDLMHWSAIRGLIAFIEALPQFFASYLCDLLQPDVVPSWSMRRDAFKLESMQRSIVQLHQALATKIPVRQFLPAVHTSIAKLFHNNDVACWREIQVIVQLMVISLRASTRADLAAMTPKTIGTLMMVYTYSGDEEGRFPLLETCNEALLALVMKISEKELRPLYARMREWKGELDVSSLTVMSARKRFVFWSITAALSKELRGLFLPCLSGVVMDVVCELEFAASKLTSAPDLKKAKHGKKRQRMSLTKDLNEPFDLENLRPLQPILLSLELAMKADAHDGGGWSRADEGQRFHLLLKPLGKLLQAKIPVELQVRTDSESELNNINAFEKLVLGQGTSESGYVAGCLTAMAAAAGNEQLWKPLNHAVLQACGNDDRPEVRKVGVQTLLSLIKTVGEEYMVLLPECLPVLSELLEDDNEDISTMAKECIRLGEELLGEGLEDSLR